MLEIAVVVGIGKTKGKKTLFVVPVSLLDAHYDSPLLLTSL
jgi:hypothetical protein